MNGFIAKFETDAAVRARVVHVVSALMILVGVVAAVSVGLLSQTP